MTSFLLSALRRMYRGAGFSVFSAAHANCWIVWEPGAWKPPEKGGETLSAARLPTPPPPSGEALALALTVRPGKPPQLTLGRAPTCDIEINDATLSQLHLLLMQAGPVKWTVRDAGSRNGTWLDSVALAPGEPKPLCDGQRLQAGQVVLTYYEPKGLFARLQVMPGGMPTPPQLPQPLVGGGSGRS
jgi:hypothetical protein